MEAGRSFDDNEAWRELTTIIELSRRRLRFVLVECEDQAVRTRLCKHLHAYCMIEQRPFFAPPPSAPEAIDWLSHQQQRAAETPAAEHPSVLFFPMPEGEEEIFCLYRLNENRDNLRRDLRGVLILAGLKGFRSRVPNHAPDLWSMREKTLELTESDLPPLSGMKEHRHEAGAWPTAGFEAALSFAHRDHEAAADLCRRLDIAGIPCAHMDPSAAMPHDPFASGRVLLVLLSPDWVNTHAEAFAKAIENAGGIEAVRGRIVPLMVRDCVPPGDLRGYTPIPWTTQAERDKWYPRLRKMLEVRWFKLHEQA